MRVYLIRHGQCEDNLIETDIRRRMTHTEYLDFLRNAPASPLTQAGVQQAHGLSARLAGVRIDRLYTSPLPRASGTAAILGKARGLTPVVVPELRELHPPMPRLPRGRLAMPHHLLLSHAAMVFSRTAEDRFISACRRVRGVWRRITAEPDEVVVVVAHGWLIWLLLFLLRFDRRWRVVSSDLDNAGISLVVTREPKVRSPRLARLRVRLALASERR